VGDRSGPVHIDISITGGKLSIKHRLGSRVASDAMSLENGRRRIISAA
jgi:hypothetical protein